MLLKTANVTDPPHVVTGSVDAIIRPMHLSVGQRLALIDGFEYRAIAVAAATDIVYLAGSGRLEKMPERAHQVEGMDIVADLLPGISENDIRRIGKSASGEIRKEAMQLSSRMAGTCNTTTTKADGLHAEISPVFLNKQIGSDFGYPE